MKISELIEYLQIELAHADRQVDIAIDHSDGTLQVPLFSFETDGQDGDSLVLIANTPDHIQLDLTELSEEIL